MLPDHNPLIKVFPTEYHLRFAPNSPLTPKEKQVITDRWMRNNRLARTATKNRLHNKRKAEARATNTQQYRRTKKPTHGINPPKPIDQSIYKEYVKPGPNDKPIGTIKNPSEKVAVGKDSNGNIVYKNKTGYDMLIVNGKKMGNIQMFYYNGKWNKNRKYSINPPVSNTGRSKVTHGDPPRFKKGKRHGDPRSELGKKRHGDPRPSRLKKDKEQDVWSRNIFNTVDGYMTNEQWNKQGQPKRLPTSRYPTKTGGGRLGGGKLPDGPAYTGTIPIDRVTNNIDDRLVGGRPDPYRRVFSKTNQINFDMLDDYRKIGKKLNRK